MHCVQRDKFKIDGAAFHVPAENIYLFFNLFDHCNSVKGESPASQADDLNLMS